MPLVSRQKTRDEAVPRDLLELTVRHVEAMTRSQLVDHLFRVGACFPKSLDRSQIDGLSDEELRQLLNRARRKLQGMGY